MRTRFGTPQVSMRLACLVLASAPALGSARPASNGSDIATKGTAGGAAACMACHGVKGEGNPAAGFPRLAGLPADYVVEQLENFAADKRKSPVMGPVAKQLSPAERKAVAGYYGAMAGPPAGKAVDDKLKRSDSGAWLALRGRWEDNLPACVQCHGPGGAGVGAAFPALTGQSSNYIAAQLHAFKSGTRPGGPLDLMKVVASKLSDADMTAVADHFGNAGAATAAATATAQAKGNK